VLALALAAAIAAGAVMAESGTVVKATELRSEPQASAEVVGQLTAQQAVEITARQGAWAGVKTDAGVEGWARILNLRTSSGQTASGGGDQLASVFRTGSRGSSVATADKGLSAAELMSASPNHGDVALLDGYAASTSDASQFAAQGPLSSQSVGYLEEDKRGRRRR
jgi:hypothetical protein